MLGKLPVFSKKIKAPFTDRVWILQGFEDAARPQVFMRVESIMELHSCFEFNVVILHVHVQMSQVIYFFFPVSFIMNNWGNNVLFLSQFFLKVFCKILISKNFEKYPLLKLPVNSLEFYECKAPSQLFLRVFSWFFPEVFLKTLQISSSS